MARQTLPYVPSVVPNVDYAFVEGPGGTILAIMCLPYIAAVSREVLLAVPPSQREAALALGATRWEAILAVILPTATSQIGSGASTRSSISFV